MAASSNVRPVSCAILHISEISQLSSSSRSSSVSSLLMLTSPRVVFNDTRLEVHLVDRGTFLKQFHDYHLTHEYRCLIRACQEKLGVICFSTAGDSAGEA